MPHVYLGKFMMNRSEFENKYGVSITTNSKDGGYLIIITGKRPLFALFLLSLFLVLYTNRAYYLDKNKQKL